MKLTAIETSLGSNKIPVRQLFDNEELIKRTGIEYVYQSTQSTVSLAYEAASKLKASFDMSSIGLCLMVTQTPDDYLPANSITLVNRLGLSPNCLALDLSQGCSGFVQALCVIEKLLPAYGNILLVTADRYRSKLNPDDRSTNAVFSDGATATICQQDSDFGIIYEDHFTDGSKRNLLFQSANKEENSGYLHMSGAEVWMFTRLKVVPQIMKSVDFCKKNGLEIDGIYIHQASRVVVDGIKSLLPQDIAGRLFENYSSIGNTVSSSIPFLLKDYSIKFSSPKSVNIFAGFGVGLTSSVMIYGKKSA